MNEYTKLLHVKAETISPDDDDYTEHLLEVVSLFRGFNETLTEFITGHGFCGDIYNIEEKNKFLREKFKSSNIPIPRNIKDWFLHKEKKVSRETIFKLCFAFHLDVNQTNEFFRNVYFERGFDCHSIEEIVYYFTIKNGYSYEEAQTILQQLPKVRRESIPDEREVLYTGNIVNYIKDIKEKQTFINYLKENIHQFTYNNVTANKIINELWSQIIGEDGLAVKEGKLFYQAYNISYEEDKTCYGVISKKEHAYEDGRRKKEEYVISSGNKDSTWTIYAQILGLDYYWEEKLSSTRSIHSILEKNKLIPFGVRESFPSRQSIEKILKGQPMEQGGEAIRKLMILLLFYVYWAKKLVDSQEPFYQSTMEDAEKCFYTINKYLLDAGYPRLYAGNPYDWIFLWVLYDENPLYSFRYFIGEVFAMKEES